MQKHFRWAIALGVWCSACSCQGYDFVFVPDTDRQGSHLRFSVETPSKADILFVVDNSSSMYAQQQALRTSFGRLLDVLAPADTSYRIGIVSTDPRGSNRDCAGTRWSDLDTPLGPDLVPDGLGNKGDCAANLTEAERPVLRRPHDGAAGRLIAAYVPETFDINNFSGLNDTQKAALSTILPTAVNDGPLGVTGQKGVPWVIDRDIVQADACTACGCSVCEKGDACMETCAAPVAEALVRAYFSSNVAGLGIDGSGYEEGLLSGLLAVGIDPQEQSDFDLALNPPDALTIPGRPNSYWGFNDAKQPELQSWLRHDALTAIMFVSDEEDCSMPKALRDIAGQFLPEGSICYDVARQIQFLPVSYMAELLTTKVGNPNRVALGFIGGLRKGGADFSNSRSATPASCFAGAEGTPNLGCSCMYPRVDREGNIGTVDDRWCNVLEINDYTSNAAICSTNPDTTAPCCTAHEGRRYIDFVRQFPRRAFESICHEETAQCDLDDPDARRYCGFGPAMANFANIALLACFDLDPKVRPARNDARLIEVKRAPRDDAVAGAEPQILERREPGALEPGWYYETDGDEIARICLTGVDRLIGDVYEIFVLTKDHIDLTPTGATPVGGE